MAESKQFPAPAGCVRQTTPIIQMHRMKDQTLLERGQNLLCRLEGACRSLCRPGEVARNLRGEELVALKGILDLLDRLAGVLLVDLVETACGCSGFPGHGIMMVRGLALDIRQEGRVESHQPGHWAAKRRSLAPDATAATPSRRLGRRTGWTPPGARTAWCRKSAVRCHNPARRG